MAGASASMLENQMSVLSEAPPENHIVTTGEDAATPLIQRENSTPAGSVDVTNPETPSSRSKRPSSKPNTGGEGSSPSPKKSNLTPNGSARAAQLKKARSARRKSSTLGQSTQGSTPASDVDTSEPASHAATPSEEAQSDIPSYVVPPERQGTRMPVPQPEDPTGLEWRQLTPSIVPLPSDPSVRINGFDTVLILTSADPPRTEHAKVLDCRRHPNGRYYLLVAWWFPRAAVAATLRGFKPYLDKHWPPDAPYEYVLGCHFDVVTSDAVVEKTEEDERFCKTQVHGGYDHLRYELFCDVPDMEERKKYLKFHHSRKKFRDELEAKQKELYRMLFPVKKTVVDV